MVQKSEKSVEKVEKYDGLNETLWAEFREEKQFTWVFQCGCLNTLPWKCRVFSNDCFHHTVFENVCRCSESGKVDEIKSWVSRNSNNMSNSGISDFSVSETTKVFSIFQYSPQHLEMVEAFMADVKSIAYEPKDFEFWAGSETRAHSAVFPPCVAKFSSNKELSAQTIFQKIKLVVLENHTWKLRSVFTACFMAPSARKYLNTKKNIHDFPW